MPGVHADCCVAELDELIPYEVCFAAGDVFRCLQAQVDFFAIF